MGLAIEQTRGSVQTIAKRFGIGEATNDDWKELNHFRNMQRSEHWPNDPPEHLERTKLSVKSNLSCVRLTDKIIASGTLEDRLDIYVLPERRRQGFGRQLLALLSEEAKAQNRQHLKARTDPSIPDGEVFARLVGGEMKSIWVTSDLELAHVNHSLMSTWVESTQKRAPSFKLGFWDGPCPENKLERTTTMFQVMNEAHGENPDHVLTVAQVRDRDAKRVAVGIGRWTMYIEDRVSGEFAGFTAISLDPHEQEIIHQGDTGVPIKFRGRGLGRWLKAAMIEKVANDLPTARLIRTGNEATNEPMIRINRDMGFEPVKTFNHWNFDLDNIEVYLKDKGQ